MTRDEFGCLLGVLLHVGGFIAFIGAGYLSWTIVCPNGFLNGVLFLILWGIGARILQVFAHFLILAIASLFEN